MSDSIISRVYDIKISGYDDSIAKVKAMSAEFAKMDAAKGKLNKQLEKKMTSGDSAVIEELTTKIKQLETEMANLSSQRNIAAKEAEAAANATNSTVSAYSALIKSYKDAKLSAQELAAEFGANSEQAKAAAASAATYKSQLDAINETIKNGGTNAVQRIANEPTTAAHPSVSKNISEYDLLVQKYKDAVAASQELAIQYGVESKEAIEAARSAAAYNQQISEIKNLVKTGGVSTNTSIVENTTVTKNVSEYDALVKKYKESVTASRELAVQFGVESNEAKVAAAATAEYKTQLDAINESIKTGGVQNEVPLSVQRNDDNAQRIANLEAENEAMQRTGTVVNELDKAEADAAMTANEWASTQQQASEVVKETATTVPEITGSLDQYTGTLRQNITAQIENGQALAANKAEQKSILDSIKESGGATETQTTRLAELKEQSLILTETNKGLTTTIRNQVQEFIAGTGSIDELQAKVNQLQQAYEKLTEEERSSPFGLEMKKELDVLEPKVKELEGTIGKFQRNVGNYPNPFAGALKTVQTELDAVQGKLVNGNFTGDEFDQLTARTKVLENALSLTGKEFATVAQQQQAFKEAGTQIGLVYGKNSDVFKQFSAGVKEGNTNIKGLTTEITTATKATGGLSKAFTSGYNGLRKLANIIPGLGISGVILLLLDPLTALAASFFKVQASAAGAKKTMADFERQADQLNGVMKDSSSSFVTATTEVDNLNRAFNEVKEGVISQEDAVKLYNDTLGKTIGYVSSLDEAERKTTQQGKAYIEMTLLKAASQMALQKAANAAFTAEEERRKNATTSFFDLKDPITLKKERIAQADQDERDFKEISDSLLAKVKNIAKENGISLNDAVPNGLIGKLKAQIEALQAKQPSLLTADEIKANVAEINRLQEQLNNLLGKSKETKDSTRASREQSDKLADEFNKKSLAALAQFNQDELTLLRNKYKEEADDQNNSQEQRTASLYKYYQVSKQLIADNTKSQQDALNLEVSQGINRAKRLTNAKKQADALNAIEQYRVNKQKEINQEGTVSLQALDKQLFDEREKRFTEDMNRQIENAKSVNKQIQDNPDLPASTKAQAQVDEDNAIIRAQVSFFLQMDSLQKVFNLTSKQNWEDFRRTMSDENDKINKDRKTLSVSVLADIDKQTDADIVNIKLKYDKMIQEILNSKKSSSEKTSAITILTKVETVAVTGRQQQGNNDAVTKAEELFKAGLITSKQFEDIYAKAIKGQRDLNNAIEEGKKQITDMKGLLKSSLSDLFGFADGSDKAKLLAETISDAFSTAGNAMNTYFDNEQNRIQNSLKLNEQRLDIELQQAKDRAQSQAEQDSLERQFAAKKEALEKQAFEKNKKLQLEQAKINLAIQLSNLAVIAFSPNPLNIATLGVAGTIMYAVQAALALVNYGLNVSRINSAQFAAAGGGKVPGKSGNTTPQNNPNPVKTFVNRVKNIFVNKIEDEDEILPNGKITKKQNIPTQSNGDNILATVKTGEVILNEEQQRKAGGPSFFKSLGVPGFAGGGIVNLGKDHIDQSTRRTELRTIDVLSSTKKTSEEKAIRLNKIVYEETLDLLQRNKELAVAHVENSRKELPKHQTTSIRLLEAEQKLKYAEISLNKFTKEHDHSFVNTVKQSIVKSFQNVFNANLTHSNSEIIKTAASSFIKNTVNEAKSSFFQKRIQDISQQAEKTETELKKEYTSRLDDKTTELNKVFTDQYVQESANNNKRSLDQKKEVALERLAVDMHGNIISVKERYPAVVSLIPAARIQNKYNHDLKSISSIIYNIEHRDSVSNVTGADNYSNFVQHFITGGKVERLPNGKITRPQNIPVQPNGDDILATVKSKEVILNEEQQRLLGGANTFRAIGVPGFAAGGMVQSLGGFNFSDKLQPPVNPSSFLNPTRNDQVNEEQMKKVYAAIDQQTENINNMGRQIHERIDKLKVINVATETEKVNNNLKKASNIGRIN